MSIWLNENEIKDSDLNISDPRFKNLVNAADSLDPFSINLGDQDSKQDTFTYAAALLAARGYGLYEEKVVKALQFISNTTIPQESNNPLLGSGRNLAAFVIAADIIGYRTSLFKNWLHAYLRTNLHKAHGKTIIGCHELRPNNHGTHCFASRVIADLFLDDKKDLARAIQVHKGYLGDTASYNNFVFNDPMSWHFDPTKPKGVNPKGSTINGYDVDGILPDDQRRSGGFAIPIPKENYVWEACQGLIIGTIALVRAGYDAHLWEDKAILRICKANYLTIHYPPEGDDLFLSYLIKYLYPNETDFVILPNDPVRYGKGLGFTDVTHTNINLNFPQPEPIPNPTPIPVPVPQPDIKTQLLDIKNHLEVVIEAL